MNACYYNIGLKTCDCNEIWYKSRSGATMWDQIYLKQKKLCKFCCKLQVRHERKRILERNGTERQTENREFCLYMGKG